MTWGPGTHGNGEGIDIGDGSELAEVRAGEHLEWQRLETYLRRAFAALEPAITLDPEPMRVLQFPHGSANLTYLLCFGDAEFVLRRPPFGRIAPGAHDMVREYRVLSRLWTALPTAPRAYLLCQDHDIVGADFVVMERRRGVVARNDIPPAMRHHREVGRRIGFAIVDAMADLHLVDAEQCGLGGLGRPDGFTRRQVEGWTTRWGLVRPEDGGNRTTAETMDTLADRLLASVPPPSHPTLVHNDIKPDNCQFDPDDPDRVRSIFDWDMTTLGEPLVDLGTLLNYWPDPSDESDASRTANTGLSMTGLPPRVEMVERYRERTGIDTSHIGWFEAFAAWKTGVVIQQLHDRWRRGESTDPRMESIADRLGALAGNAVALLDRLGA